MATLTPTGASGTGTETLTFNLGANDSGSTKTYSFKLRQTGSSETADTLTITQATSGVDVTSVEVVPGAVTINRGTSYDYQLEANVYPTNASDKRVTWSSDDSSKVDVGNTGWIRGVAVTSTAVGVHATSVADQSKSDYCLVTVVEAGSITLSNVNKLSTDTSASMPITLSNIDASTLQISSTGTSWVTVRGYDSSQGVIHFDISSNAGTTEYPTQSRDAAVTVTGRDLAGALRTATATLSQNGSGDDSIALLGITVTGTSVIEDSGQSEHLYNLTYNPSNTSEKGIVWDVIDANSGDSVVGSLVSIRTSSTACWVTVLSGADGDDVLVTATSTIRPLISGSCAVNVTYVQASSTLHAEPEQMDTIGWNSTSDSTVVLTWGNVSTPYIPQNGGFGGFITGASLNTQTGVITVSFAKNTSTSSRSGWVKVEALGSDTTPESITINYTQVGKPDPTVNYGFWVNDLSVWGGVRPGLSANVYLQNKTGIQHTFYGSFSWALYGYTSSEDLSNPTTVHDWSTFDDYNPTVDANTTVTIPLSYNLTGTLGMLEYFKIVVSMGDYGEDSDYAELSSIPDPD